MGSNYVRSLMRIATIGILRLLCYQGKRTAWRHKSRGNCLQVYFKYIVGFVLHYCSCFSVSSHSTLTHSFSSLKMSPPIPIAIIGMGCRLPGGANSPEELWDMLAEGRSGWGEVPKERWDWRSFYHPDQSAKESLNYKSGYFIPQDITAFDARFFGIPPGEAHGIDPQQRILLESTWDAIENAGIPPDSLRGSDTSVYMAIFARDYDRMSFKDTSQLHKMHVTGKGEAIFSNRISYLLDLKGASMTIDTGCVSRYFLMLFPYRGLCY